jgi:catechol 2,3-dioxygenase-like lactoylglutathione lyase family enzyme
MHTRSRIQEGSALPSQIDHIVIGVRDLAEASANYERAGFTVIPGGEHVGGRTHNALVSFADGSYFEIIAFTNPDQRPESGHRWWDQIAAGDGLVDYAVLSPGLAAESAEIADRGIEVSGPHDGGRVRPDGQQIAWKTLHTVSADAPLPFVIEDVSARNLRVPDGDATVHPGGFTGVARLVVAVNDLDAARVAYANFLGTSGAATKSDIPDATAWRFPLGPHAIDLVAGGNIVSDYLANRGASPFEIVLRGSEARVLAESTTNGVRIRIVDEN